MKSVDSDREIETSVEMNYDSLIAEIYSLLVGTLTTPDARIAKPDCNHDEFFAWVATTSSGTVLTSLAAHHDGQALLSMNSQSLGCASTGYENCDQTPIPATLPSTPVDALTRLGGILGEKSWTRIHRAATINPAGSKATTHNHYFFVRGPQSVDRGAASSNLIHSLATHVPVAWALFLTQAARSWPGRADCPATLLSPDNTTVLGGTNHDAVEGYIKRNQLPRAQDEPSHVGRRAQGRSRLRISEPHSRFWLAQPLVGAIADDQRRKDSLTNREYEVAVRIALGWSFKEVAMDLGLSPSTAATYCYRAYKKLKVVGRKQLRSALIASGQVAA